MYIVYKVYSDKKYQRRKILIIHQRRILVVESPVYNRHLKALKMCFVLFPPPPKCTVSNKQNILAAFVTVNYYSKSSGEMFLSQEQYVFRILWTSNFTKLSYIKKLFVSERILCASSKAKFETQRGMSCLNAIKYPSFLRLQTSNFFKTCLKGNRRIQKNT